jgi:hypothetical protein
MSYLECEKHKVHLLQQAAAKRSAKGSLDNLRQLSAIVKALQNYSVARISFLSLSLSLSPQ